MTEPHEAHVSAWRNWRHNQARQFLRQLDPDATEFTFQTFDDTPAKRRDLAQVRHGSFDSLVDSLEAANQAQAGIFVTANETDGKGRQTGNVRRVRAVFVDLDGAPLQAVLDAPLQPHIYCESSASRYHAYWVCGDCPLDKFESVQLALSRRFDSDPVVHDLSRVMRLPGFRHNKGAPQITVLLDGGAATAAAYPLAEIVDALNLELDRREAEPVPKQTVPGAIAVGGRNSFLSREAFRLRKQGYSEDQTEAVLLAINQAKCSPPLDNAEVSAIVAGKERVAAGRDPEAAPWPEPREIKADLPAAPPFQAGELLPKVLADFVLDEADRMPCAPDYIAAALLVALGSVIGAKCALKPKRRDDWIVTANLYGGVVGNPSEKKTPAVAVVMRFLDRLEAKTSEELEDSIKVFEAEKAAFEAHQAAVKSSMKKAASDAHQDKLKKKAACGTSTPTRSAATETPATDLMGDAIANMSALEEPEQPHARRFKSNDSTIEKLAELLTHNPHGLLVYRDELVGLLASWEKDGREGDRAFYLEGWNGTGSFNTDRIGRGSLAIKCLCLSVFGGIQPELLERYLAAISHSLDNDGRFQRFQVLVYPEPVRWEWRDRYPVKAARDAVRALFDRLAAFDAVQDGATVPNEFVKLAHFGFDDEAQEVFIEWSKKLHNEWIANETNPLMQQHLGKFEKLFCAVSLILHLAEGSIGEVRVESANRAVAWCEYLAGHARRIYGLVEAARINTARTLGRRICEGKLQDHFTARDVWKKGWGGIKSTADAEIALAILEDYGWLQSYETGDQPGRPTTRYVVNPQTRGPQ